MVPCQLKRPSKVGDRDKGVADKGSLIKAKGLYTYYVRTKGGEGGLTYLLHLIKERGEEGV